MNNPLNDIKVIYALELISDDHVIKTIEIKDLVIKLTREGDNTKLRICKDALDHKFSILHTLIVPSKVQTDMVIQHYKYVLDRIIEIGQNGGNNLGTIGLKHIVQELKESLSLELGIEVQEGYPAYSQHTGDRDGNFPTPPPNYSGTPFGGR